MENRKITTKSVMNFLSNNAIIILILLLAFVVGCVTENFFKPANFKNLVVNVSPRFIIACGVSGCLITKGTDLSAGRAVGLSACLAAMMLQSVDYAARALPWMPDLPWFVALLVVILIMAVFGAINGCVIAFLKVPPFIATLGMQTIVYGLCSVVTGNDPLGGFKSSYSQVALGSLGPIPYLAIFAVIVGAYMLFLYNKTRPAPILPRTCCPCPISSCSLSALCTAPGALRAGVVSESNHHGACALVVHCLA